MLILEPKGQQSCRASSSHDDGKSTKGQAQSFKGKAGYIHLNPTGQSKSQSKGMGNIYYLQRREYSISMAKGLDIRSCEELEPIIPILTHIDLFFGIPSAKWPTEILFSVFTLHIPTDFKTPLVVKHTLIWYTTKKKLTLLLKIWYSASRIGLCYSILTFLSSVLK